MNIWIQVSVSIRNLRVCKLQQIDFATHLSPSCGRWFWYGKSFMYSVFISLTISEFTLFTRDVKFHDLYERSASVANENDISPTKPRSTQRQRHTSNAPVERFEDHYRVNFFKSFMYSVFISLTISEFTLFTRADTR
jgi:hypothetical protein